MADEPLVNLEEDGPTAPPADTPATPIADTPATPNVTPPAETPPVDDPELSAHADDDDRVKGILNETTRLRHANRDLKGRVEQGDQAQQWIHQNRAYIEFLQQNPDFLKPHAPEPVPAAPAGPVVDPEAEEAAKLMDFFKADGTPDLDRGARFLKMQQRRADQATAAAVQPLTESRQREQAQQNYQYLTQLTYKDGSKINPAIVNAVWTQAMKEPGALETLSNPQALGGLSAVILGVDAYGRFGNQPAPPPQAPVPSLASGGAPGDRPTLSALEKDVAAARGKTDKEFVALQKGFRAGRESVLEDD